MRSALNGDQSASRDATATITANAGWAIVSARAPLVGVLASELAVLLPDVDAELEVLEGLDAVDREGTDMTLEDEAVVVGTEAEDDSVGEEEPVSMAVVTVVETSVVYVTDTDSEVVEVTTATTYVTLCG